MFVELLLERLKGVASLSREQAAALHRHYELLARWNKVVNLTSVRNVAEAVERHYCESVFLATRLPPGGLAVVDVGSGAGFPGFPLAVVRPECTVTLVESHQRKAVFLREAGRELPNVRVLSQRAETVEERFDWAVSRAVNPADIAAVLKRLAANLALLGGEEKPDVAAEWGPALRLPWGDRRFLWITASRGMDSVSRETGQR